MMKKYAYLDTVRSIAVLFVFISHYAMFFNFERLDWVYNIFFGNKIGVFLFLVVSGFLAMNSLKKSDGCLVFYKKRLIRIVIPYLFAYISMSLIFLFLGIFNNYFLTPLPLTRIMYTGGNYVSFLLSCFPVDLNLIYWLGLNNYFFIGEWFIGAILILYLFSPLLKKLIEKTGIYSYFIMLIIVATLYFFNAKQYLFLESLPFFWGYHLHIYLLGFLIYIYMPKVEIARKTLILGFLLLLVVFIFHMIYYADLYSLPDRLYNNFGSYILNQFLFVNFFFVFLKYLNDKFDLSKFNQFSKYSYCFMLIHHVILYAVTNIFSPTQYSKFGLLFFGVVSFLITLFLSVKITNLYKPIEEKIINKFCD